MRPAAGGDGFGYWVAIDGDTVAVVPRPTWPAPTAARRSSSTGRRRAGRLRRRSWPPTPRPGTESSGDAVAIDGDTLVVGAPFDGEAGTGAAPPGCVRTAASPAGPRRPNWSAPTPLSSTAFRASVAIDGDTLVIGASGDDDATGSAYRSGRGAGGWTEQAVPARPVRNRSTGSARRWRSTVTRSWSACRTTRTPRPFAGSARVFSRTADPAVWDEVATLVDPSSAIGSFFGWSVSAHDGRVLVGSQRADDAAGVAPRLPSGRRWVGARCRVACHRSGGRRPVRHLGGARQRHGGGGRRLGRRQRRVQRHRVGVPPHRRDRGRSSVGRSTTRFAGIARFERGLRR
ncbi:MAG: hypothetical protein H6514_14280 [Acidimicrobiaceae bacterium]|nr:hypothetical protein [Acidimicrobiaceae bacterium]